MGNVISKIEDGSPLKHRIRVGDTLLAINGKEVVDVLDYKFFGYDPEVSVTVRTPEGLEHTVHVAKAEGQDLGLEFKTYLMDKPRSCANNCVFCFIDQLPKGMRRTMYFKDDDARLSFLLGNYITMTNLSDRAAGQNAAQPLCRKMRGYHAPLCRGWHQDELSDRLLPGVKRRR